MTHAQKPKYEPPQQTLAGQIADSILILVLVTASLFAPVYFKLAADKRINLTFPGKDWAGMGQNAVAQQQWQKLGFTPDSAHDMIASRFDYSFSWTMFLITAAVIIVYFVFVIYVSDKEYKDVIGERFDSGV